MRVGDTVVLPFDESAKDIDVRTIVGVVIAITGITISVIDGFGVIHRSTIDEVHTIATYDKTLLQFTTKGVELIDKIKHR